MQQNNNKPVTKCTQKIKVIINADDYGYCEERSKGIRELIEMQCITSTTVIINAPQIEEQCGKLIQTLQKMKDKFVSECKGSGGTLRQHCWGDDKGIKQIMQFKNHQNYQLSIGLHLNFTQFTPLSCQSSSHKVSIVDPNTNTFKGKQYIYENLSKVLEDPCLQTFLENQIHFQVQKFISIFKQRPSHLDSHNHTHTIPKFAAVIAKIARLYGIYKIRMPIPYSLHETGNKNLDNFNQKLIQQTLQSKKIYEQYGFLFPSVQIGLDTMGKDFTVGNIQNRLQEIIQGISSYQLTNSIVQIMVHPGYPQLRMFQKYATCAFSMSDERQLQLQTLKILSNMKLPIQLASFHNLQSQKTQKCLILYSKLLKSSGNLTTALRLHRIISQNLGYRVYFMNVCDQSEADDEVYLHTMLKQLGVKCIVGINLTRTAGVIHRVINGKVNRGIGWKIPYILVIAGTDANVTLVNGKKQILHEINESIKQCTCLASISSKLKQKVEQYLQNAHIDKEVKLIVQSSQKLSQQVISNNNFKSCPMQISSCMSLINSSGPYIIFPTSFRKVKCPHHILSQLNQLMQVYPTLQCFIAGPIIDQQYFKKTLPLLKKVKYLQCLPHEQYMKLLKNSLVLINCSESQGMSCSILEAFSEKIPVIVRKNQGNCELVKQGINGYIYENGKDFVAKFEYVFKNYEFVKNTICQNAYKDFQENFSYQKQCNSYIQLFNAYIEPLLYPLNISLSVSSQSNQKPKMVHILSLKNVHGVSPVNLKIFNKFFEYDKNQVNPCVKYIGKIIGHLQEEETLSILDIGCGSGIFCIFFVLKMIEIFNNSSKVLHLRLVFSDIHEDSLKNLTVNIKTLQQLCNSPQNKAIKIQKIQIIKSNMFCELEPNSFNIILANMPQTPFQDQKSRLDKNGGQDGFKLTKQLLQKYQKYLKNNSTSQFNFLLMLYSHMLQDNKFQQIAHSNGSAINWVSEKEIHRITREDYDKMEERLAYLIEQRVQQGGNGVKIQGNVFIVPAELRLLQKIGLQ